MNKKMHGRENDTVEVVELEKSDVAKREEEVLAFWQEHDIFNKSIKYPAGIGLEGDKVNAEGREGALGHFVFYDGPPFATGLPHYGHLLAGTIKDAIPRFWTMNGYRVRRKWGWDCHGLPLENLIEKELGLATKKDIEEYGIKNFNEKARGAVLRYADDWRQIVPRMGRFVDMQGDYRTMDASYTESVWWVFKQLHEKGLVNEGFKSMHLCPRCGTTLSNFEVNQGYKDIKDIAVTVKLPLLDDAGALTDTSLLVWTTTPWTLPGNLAAAVNEEFTYVKVEVETESGKEKVILAKGRLKQLGDLPHEVLEEMKGTDLVGKKYQPPFNYLQKQDMEGKGNAWTIYHADYVELGEEGTGAVHLAPAFGEDDMKLAQSHGVPVFHHVNMEGKFKDFITDFAGQLVKPKDDDSGVSHLDADIEIVKALKANGTLFKKENITHSYPHCWRCDTPLLNYATTSWFVDVPAIKDKLVAENAKVNWVPGHVGTNRFGKWLEGARDWAISRQRYWGAPLPIWKNPETGDYKVFGSLAELQEYVPKSGNTYLLMRHGESESNAHDVVQTSFGVKNPLTEKGKQEVREAIEKLKDKGITKVITSPYERTTQTAAMVVEALQLPSDALISDKRIGEIQLGEMEGESNKEYQKFIADGAQWCNCAPKGGESWSDVRDRMGEFFYDVDEQYSNETILVISHNSPLRMVSAVAHGSVLADTDFDHDADGKRFNNAEVRELEFAKLPHNDHYELDFHRPYIDEIDLYENGVKLERVLDVFDCWFESGSMPYGQHHYPFACKDDFLTERFPAQFISEAIDQTRGWFYSLMVLGVALFDKAPFQNVVTNGLVLAEDGRKMSKSLQNYPDPMELVARQGADSMRFYLLSSSIIKGEDLSFSEKEVQELQRKNIGRLHNVLAMYEQYQDGTEARDDSDDVLDRWIVARLNELITETTAGYKNYELDKATRPITDFIDDLSVWYLRRSRDRLKGEDLEDRKLALATLRHVLKSLALVMAPVMPFYADHLWCTVRDKNDAESVHLAKWPEAKEFDTDLLKKMEQTRDIVTAALEQRTKAGIKVRQPINRVTGPEITEEFQVLVLDEVNAKTYHPTTAEMIEIDTKLTSELLAEGAVRELMRAVQGTRKTAGLEPQDPIELMVNTDEAGVKAIEAHRGLLVSTVGATVFHFAENDGEELESGDYRFQFMITKV